MSVEFLFIISIVVLWIIIKIGDWHFLKKQQAISLMDKCYYEFSDVKFNPYKVNVGFQGQSVEEIQNMVLARYTLNELTDIVLADLKEMFSGFVLKKGLYKFTLHNNKKLEFYWWSNVIEKGILSQTFEGKIN